VTTRIASLASAALFLCTSCETPKPAPPSAPSDSPAAVAHDLDADHAALRAKNVADLTVELETVDGQKRFRRGEVINLVLSFSSTSPGRHELAMHEYDRSGRMWSESFMVSPAGGSADPLKSYFAVVGGSMGGLSPMPKPIGSEPIEIRLTLNEWVRFDRAGTHRLFVTSARSGSATTNVIEIELVDDPAWLATELERIRGDLRKQGEPRAAALRRLRFLGGADAAKEIVTQLCLAGERHDSDLHFGAHGQRNRAHMISVLERGLAAPSCAVSGHYLDLLTRLEMAGKPRPPDWGMAHRQARAPFLVTLAAAKDGKEPAARAVVTHTLLDVQREDEQSAGRADPVADARRVELASLFDSLEEDAQVRILADEWLTVRTPAMAPTLAKLAAEARPRGRRMRSLSDHALERWLDVDLGAARAFILAEIARPTGARVSFTGRTLGLLADRTLPSLDDALVAGMRAPRADGKTVYDGATLELRAEVAARYASPAVRDAMWELYRASDYFRMSLLTYLVRNDTEHARALVSGLTVGDLDRLAKIEWSEPVQQAAIAHLDDPEPGRGADAARLLASFGTADARPALYARLRSLGTKAFAMGSPERELHRRLRRTITHANGWVTTPAELDALAATCGDDACRREVQHVRDRWAAPKRTQLVFWSHAASGNVSGWVGQYSLTNADGLLAKLGQLPRGTALVWSTEEKDVDRALLARVRAAAQAAGVTIVRP
jgi:hypothetical protein